jgi:hypothetical protein
MGIEYSKTLESIAKFFVESGIYESTDEFVCDLVKDVAARKVRAYAKKVKAYVMKFGSFQEFTRKLQGRASVRDENQWMGWEAAINMLTAWKRVTTELGFCVS